MENFTFNGIEIEKEGELTYKNGSVEISNWNFKSHRKNVSAYDLFVVVMEYIKMQQSNMVK